MEISNIRVQKKNKNSHYFKPYIAIKKSIKRKLEDAYQNGQSSCLNYNYSFIFCTELIKRKTFTLKNSNIYIFHLSTSTFTGSRCDLPKLVNYSWIMVSPSKITIHFVVTTVHAILVGNFCFNYSASTVILRIRILEVRNKYWIWMTDGCLIYELFKRERYVFNVTICYNLLY